CGEILFRINDVEWPQGLEGIILARRLPCRFRKFPGLELSETRGRISSLQKRLLCRDLSQTDRIQILLRFSEVVGAVRHQLDGNDERDDSCDDPQHSGRDFTLAELVGNKTRRKQRGDTPAQWRENWKPAR